MKGYFRRSSVQWYAFIFSVFSGSLTPAWGTQKDLTELREERLQRRMVEVAQNKGKTPGPQLPWYKYYTWGELPSMYHQGLLGYISSISQKYGKEGTPIEVPFGPATMVIVSDPDD